MLLILDAQVDSHLIFQNQIEPKCIYQLIIWCGKVKSYKYVFKFQNFKYVSIDFAQPNFYDYFKLHFKNQKY